MRIRRPSSTAALAALAFFIALGGTALAILGPATSSASAGWSAPASIDSNPLFSVSCPSASFCAAGDQHGNALTYNGSSWTTPALIDVYISHDPHVTFTGPPPTMGSSLTSVSCPSAAFCVAVDISGDALTYDGTSWNWPTSCAGAAYCGVNMGSLASVSCPSVSFCVAVGQGRGAAGKNPGSALIFNGSSWGAPTSVDNNPLFSVSCPSASFCAAVDQNGNALSYNGSSWSPPTPTRIGDDHIKGDSIDSISCPSASFCAAVTAAGYAMTYNGRSWSAPAKITPFFNPLRSVSCPSASFCVAAADINPLMHVNNGLALTYNGRSWSAPAKIDNGQGLKSVSCPSASFCVAGDDKGRALTYTAAGPQVTPGPTNTALPTIKGKTKTGNKLVANKGRWTGTSPITYKYQWKSCNNRAKQCKTISGATKPTIVLGRKYVGHRLEVVITAVNATGRATATSKATAVIQK